ncbi:MAG: ABC transporter ATP-binding protein [Ruminococcus sp.]|nr:ABC transporter ATP-binding protein [Ruminococcus sp.]MCI5616810.1 ABC transporter ATP-binding protein/permease [Ruminococcus sp.]MDD6532012.1 ABC transporter ATP-binding protein [Ruminococcus sp.]
MKKLLKHFKPAIIPIIFVVILLVIQAYCDLSLPTYMSNIVNVGIQQSGIETVTPDKAPKSEMDKIELFMDKNDKDFVNSQYKSEKYKNKDILVLKENISDKNSDKLADKLTKPMLITYMLEKGEKGELSSDSVSGKIDNKDFQKIMENGVKEMTPENQMKFMEINKKSQAGETVDMFEILPLFSENTMSQITDVMNDKLKAFDKLGEDTITQVVTPYTESLMKSAGVDTDQVRMNYLFKAGALMLGYAGIIFVCMIAVSLLSSIIGARFSKDIRSHAYNQIINFSASESNKFSNASLITRCTNDIQQIQMVLVMMLRMIIYAPILGIGALLKVTNMSSGMVWVIALAVGVILVLVASLMVVAMPKFTALQKLVDKVNLVSREILTGLPVIRAFSREDHENERFDDANKTLTKTNLFVNRVMAIMMPAMMFIMNGTTVLIVWVGANETNAGNMQVGDIMAYIQYTMQIIMSFLMICMASIMIPRAFVSARRLGEIYDTDITIHNPENPKEFEEKQKGVVEFKDVTFAYPGAEEPVLKDISFTAKPGETTAIIGSTGSGKSTLINLIPRFYDTTKGSVTVDGQDIKDVKLTDLRDKIGYVPQKGMLFSGTIKSNIAFANEDLPMEKIEKAAEIAHATEFINEKPNKYDTHISQGGTNVSGGQRQRLSIARAIANEPEVLIFDDSFSALDFKTDVAVRKALSENIKNSTILIVAQRISTVLNAEQILVLDNGKIVGKGTHKELLKNCQVYRDIAESQLSKEELQ